MDPPTIQGYTVGPMLGMGVSGVVYEATRADGKNCAVKVFDLLASNPTLLANRISRLRESALSGVTLSVLAQTLDARPACVVMPVCEVNLQLRLADYLGLPEPSWALILQLAHKLSQLHSARIAHGNLKPGNIFLTDNGEPLLSDYATGLMPGVHRLNYTDALLYAPPEQLRNAEAYLDEAGYRWDVYAFGVLAFRLLNGTFPRCHEIFEKVSPEPGTKQRFNVEADLPGIAHGLEQSHLAAWQSEPADEVEKYRRHIVESCLALNPLERPSDMMEVHHRFTALQEQIDREAQLAVMTKSARKTQRRKKVAVLAAQIFGSAALVLGALWAWAEQRRQNEAAEALADYQTLEIDKDEVIASLEQDVLTAREAEKKAITSQDRIQEALDGEQEKSRGELAAAQLTNETLMTWILEKGVPGLPTLQGRSGRLLVLEKQLREQLLGLEGRKGLEAQSARLRYRLAEVILASGRSEEGFKALARALEQGGNHLAPVDVAQLRLRHLLLLSENPGETNVTQALTATTQAVAQAWPVDSPVAQRARAALDLVNGRLAARAGRSKEALTFYYDALRTYQVLSRQHPESPALYFTLGRAYLAAGKVAEGAGAINDAATLQGYAAEQFLKLAKTEEGDSPEIAYQIASATAAKAVSKWQQGDTFLAKDLANQGVGKLSALAAKMPTDFRITKDLASQQGIIATTLRDEGKPGKAAKLLQKGITSLESGLKNHEDDLEARYLLASLRWQLCGLLGQQGAAQDEIELGISARDELLSILAAKQRVPHPYLVRKSLAYLCGDLGHSVDLHGDRALAIDLVREALAHWQELLKLRPESPENLEGIRWARDLLKDLEVG